MRVTMIDTGAQTPFYDYALCDALTALGCDVELVTSPFIYGQLPPPKAPTREVFGRLAVLPVLRQYSPLRRVARALEYPFDWTRLLLDVGRTHPDLVHVQWAMLQPVDAAAFRVLRALGTRLVYTVHDLQAHEPWRQRWLSTRPLFSRADELIVHTESNRRALMALADLPPARVHVIPHGALASDAGPPIPASLARRSLGLPDDAPTVLFFGAIKPYKGLAWLIEALPRVLEHHPETHLLIAGYPTEPFGRYWRAIERLHLREHVSTRLEFIHHQDVSRYFCAATVVVLPYTHTTFSGVLVAAYSFSRPVIVSATGGLAETVQEDETGYVVPPCDVSALASALIRLLDAPSESARMAQRAYELAMTKHAWPTVARATVEVYRRALSG